MMITSAQNPKLKQIRALMGRAKERREAGLFVVEGVRLVEELVISNWVIHFALYDENLNERGKNLVASLKSQVADVEEVSESIMKSLSETESPQGIIAVVEYKQLPIIKLPNFVLIPDQIRDPGNLGTLIRSAAASGVDAVLLPPETTDPFAPKVLRAGMGAHFRLPIHTMGWDEISTLIKPLKIFLADMGGTSCWELNLREPLALIIGSEAEGASASARKLIHQKISIPMNAQVESLNAGVAGSALMFEVMRQRTGN